VGHLPVPNDPGPAPVAVPGPVRLALEAAVFAGGIVGYAAGGHATVALGFGAVGALHYVASYDRVGRLLRTTGVAPQS